MRDTITLACQSCKQRNYTTTKNKKTVPHKLELKKYCPFCKSHTPHKETK
ncbi:50S ribosomal protein L33 [uncultured Desulfobulbus sp.]|jgi:large subunit ribosomal protein L33|nr:50S ribosomal protein L33 [uncultured Desulfobulbus sp.]